MRETMIAAIASVALGTATMATFGTMAVAHGGVGRGGHFGGFGGHFAGVGPPWDTRKCRSIGCGYEV
jgi:hypothetical protein